MPTLPRTRREARLEGEAVKEPVEWAPWVEELNERGRRAVLRHRQRYASRAAKEDDDAIDPFVHAASELRYGLMNAAQETEETINALAERYALRRGNNHE